MRYLSQSEQGGGTPVIQDWSLAAYREFNKRKCEISQSFGFTIEDDEIHPWLKPHQRATVRWMVEGGRRALFASFGLGKSVMQLEAIRLILKRVGGRGLIVAPLGVRQEFARDAAKLGIEIKFIRSIEEAGETGIYLTNYETVRDGKLNPKHFTVASLDESAVLRGFGGVLTFRAFMKLFDGMKYKFVATATPDPNEFIELLAYSAFLEVMDVSAAKTRFFKRDSTKADKLTIHKHKEHEFWLWVSSWGMFLSKPSDLGFDDAGYSLPDVEVIYHEVPVDHGGAQPERDGQGRMFREALHGVVDAATEKRNTIEARITKMCDILAAEPDEHFLLWHDLEDERRAIQTAVPSSVAVYGAQRGNPKSQDDLEKAISNFAEGRLQYLSVKARMFGSGPNFQHHCARAIFVGVGFKFAEFIQAYHRIVRFLQGRPVKIHIIYAESERLILQNLKDKWERFTKRAQYMSELIKEYGLSQAALQSALMRSLGVERVEVSGPGYRLVNNDCVEETHAMADNSVHLVLSSIPFSSQYEYSPNYNDFGHSASNEEFFAQLDFLTPQLLRILKPGRLAAIHVKDRVVPGGMNGLGFQTIYPFHLDCVSHFQKHGFALVGIKTIVTDVVRENNQTYRLGWSEQCKDGSKMGFGLPEYLLLFRKPSGDPTDGYADEPVVKDKPVCIDAAGDIVPFDRNLPIKPGTGYSRSRWQIDAHGYTRSSGDRSLTPAELEGIPHHAIFKLYRRFSLENVYDFEHHVRLGETLEAKGILPVTFMLLQPQSWHPDVYSDITRMLTLNGAQSAKGRELHLCPIQFDLVDRAIAQYTMEGETVFDPFGGLGTVPYRAVLKGRKGYSVELSPRYWLDSAYYCKSAAEKVATPGLFDVAEAESGDEAAVPEVA